MDTELIKKAEQKGIDPNQIRQDIKQEYGDFSKKVIDNLAESAIREKIQNAELDTVTGLVAGHRDRHGKNWPVRISLLRRNGDHVEVSTWGRHIGDNEIPNGKVAEIAANYDSEYDSYSAKALNNAQELDNDLVEAVNEIAVPPQEVGRSDEYSIQAIQGTIRYINPQSLFEDGEPVGDGDVLMPDSDGELQPHLQIAVYGDDDDVQVRGHLEQQRHGHPLIQVEGLQELARAAHDKYDSPERQTTLIGQGLRGTPVVLVGPMSGYDQWRDDDGNRRTSIDMNLSAVVQVGEIESGSKDASEPEAPPETEDEDEAEEEVKEIDLSGEVDSPVNDLANDIKDYAAAIDADPDDLNASDVKAAMDIDAPEGIVKEALRRLNEGAANVTDGKPQASELAAEHGMECPMCSYSGDYLEQHLKASHDDEVA